MPASKHVLRGGAVTIPVIGGLLALVNMGAQAQRIDLEQAPDVRGLAIVPHISISETYTDNYRLAAENEQSELITQVSPGLRLSSNFGRIKGFVDYSLASIAYARNSASNNFQNSLLASMNAEAVENWAYLDINGSVSQQSVSAFGTRSVDSQLVDANRAEVSTFSVSPYVRGRLADVANYEVRLVHTASNSDVSNASDSTTTSGQMQISGNRRALGWSANASRQVVDFSASRQTENDRLNGALSYAVIPELVLSVRGGREFTNVTSVDKRSSSTSGLGLAWTPTDRTTISADRERRFFGNSHTISFRHRMPRSAWTFSSSRGISSESDPVFVNLGTWNDLISALDAITGDQFRRDLIARGGSPTDPIIGQFLKSSVSVQRGQNMSFALLGLRDTITFSASRSEHRRLDNVMPNIFDDFSSTDVIRQRGLSLRLAHRLTPQSSLDVGVAREKTTGTLASQAVTLRSINVNWSTKLGQRTGLTLGMRRALFDSSSSPYAVLGLSAALNMQF